MTDRVGSFLVTLEGDIRVDDAEATLNAIRMIRRVISVEPLISNIEQQVAEGRVRRELGDKILKAIFPESR
jgi:hypothetical protein